MGASLVRQLVRPIGVVSPEHSTDDLSHEFQIIALRQLVHPNMHKARSFPRSPAKNTAYFHTGCQYSNMLCFHMYKPRTNSEYTSHRTLYNGRNTSSGKALACCFFICTNLKQTLFKPQIYGAGRCQQVRQDFKEKFN